MPETYNPENAAKLKHLASLASKTSTALAALDGKKFQKVTLSPNGLAILFWTSDDTSGTPAYTIDLPEEIFLDQLQTGFVQNFAWSNTTYPGSTNPNLDGKPVFVLAVKGDKETNPYLSYSFVNLETLIDTYTPANAGINIAGYSIGVQLSATQGNLLSIAQDGLLVGHDDSKVDKDINAVQGNFAIFGTSGAVVDSGIAFATDAEVAAMLETYFPSGGSSQGGGE